MDYEKYFIMNEEEVKAILKELDHLFISRDNMACYITVERMHQFLVGLKDARTSKDNQA